MGGIGNVRKDIMKEVGIFGNSGSFYIDGNNR